MFMQLNFTRGLALDYRINTRLPAKSRFSMLSLLKAIFGFFWIFWILPVRASKLRIAIPLIPRIFFVLNCCAAMSAQGHFVGELLGLHLHFQGVNPWQAVFRRLVGAMRRIQLGILLFWSPKLVSDCILVRKLDKSCTLQMQLCIWRPSSVGKCCQHSAVKHPFQGCRKGATQF